MLCAAPAISQADSKLWDFEVIPSRDGPGDSLFAHCRGELAAKCGLGNGAHGGQRALKPVSIHVAHTSLATAHGHQAGCASKEDAKDQQKTDATTGHEQNPK
jgi:hypothetical protein